MLSQEANAITWPTREALFLAAVAAGGRLEFGLRALRNVPPVMRMTSSEVPSHAALRAIYGTVPHTGALPPTMEPQKPPFFYWGSQKSLLYGHLTSQSIVGGFLLSRIRLETMPPVAEMVEA